MNSNLIIRIAEAVQDVDLMALGFEAQEDELVERFEYNGPWPACADHSEDGGYESYDDRFDEDDY